MYSYEINQLFANCNYIVDAKTYLHIADTSPQITHIKYDPFENTFNISTVDGFQWKIRVKG